MSLKAELDGVALVADAATQARLLVTSCRFAHRPANLPPDVRFLTKPWLPLDVLSAVQDAVAAY